MNAIKRVVTGWRGIALAAVTGFLALAMVGADAEAARRFGGGKSFGRQSQNVERQQTQPPARDAAGQAAPAQQGAQPGRRAAAAGPQPLDGPARRPGGRPGHRCAAVCVRPERRVREHARQPARGRSAGVRGSVRLAHAARGGQLRRPRSGAWSPGSRRPAPAWAGSTTTPLRRAPAASRRPSGLRVRPPTASGAHQRAVGRTGRFRRGRIPAQRQGALHPSAGGVGRAQPR